MEVYINKTLYNSISPFLYIGNISGFIVVSLSDVGSRYRIRFSRKWIAYAYIFTFVNSSLLIYNGIIEVQNHFVMEYQTGTAAAVFTQHLSFTILILIPLSSVIMAKFKWAPLCNMLRNLDEIDKRIPPKKTKTLSTKNRSLIQFTIVSIFIWFTHFMNSFSWYFLSNGIITTLDDFIHHMPSYLLEYQSYLMQVLYCHLVNLVKERINRLNFYLRSPMYGFDKVTSVQDLIIVKDEGRQPVLRKKFNIVRDDSSEEPIANLVVVHRNLYNVVCHMNDVFGLLLLFLLISYVFFLVISPYHLYIKMKKSSGGIILITEVFWLILRILKLILIVEACGNCIEKIDHTIFIVRQHLASNLTTKVRMQFDILSEQLAECPVKFTTMGIAEIDRGLIASVAGLVTTYLVVLFQID